MVDHYSCNRLQEFEEHVQQIEKNIKGMPPPMNINPPRESKFWDAKIGITHVLMNIRERVETFITELENPSPTLVSAVTVVGAESPMRKDGRIFIGHGGSLVWMQLKDFLQEKLGLQADEFNRESTAGIATVARLQKMLDAASFAFLIMTAEDEHVDKTFHARENVIHEVGLFQGKLTFKKAIVLLEEGCAEFSNIRGLTAIRFPKGNIMAKSEEIRGVLRREGILSSTSS